MSIDRELSLLMHAARVSPPLRDAVRKVEIEVEHLRSVVADAITDLDAVHRPHPLTEGTPRPTCVMCDGSWPCTSRMVADDLRQALGDDR